VSGGERDCANVGLSLTDGRVLVKRSRLEGHHVVLPRIDTGCNGSLANQSWETSFVPQANHSKSKARRNVVREGGKKSVGTGRKRAGDLSTIKYHIKGRS